MEKNDTERQIIAAAKQVFVEKGYAEASMSDIANRAGINRPALHYYFRTKDKMFEAVFADIVHSFVPAILEIVRTNAPVEERVSQVVDVYLETMQREPLLPMFVVREVQRDVAHLLETAKRIETKAYLRGIGQTLQDEMARGEIRTMSVEFVFYTFYGLLFAPFLAKPLTTTVFSYSEKDFNDRMRLWKRQMVSQLTHLLCV